ncbi:MAG: hypothetical protein QXS68_08245, partial [Candidatus Methanomethylicaceae archaeon]
MIGSYELLGPSGRPISRTLKPGESYIGKLTASLPIALPGNYRVIVRTDTFDDIFEGPNNRNNITVSADSIKIDVKTLTLGIEAEDKLSTGEQILYRVKVESGKTLEIELTSDAEDAANELYVRFEGLPSSLKHDAAFEGHLLANQKVVIPRTNAGYYYILIRGQSEPKPDTPIKLQARILPFGITQVTPDRGGDDRYVTFTIRGAQFDPNATVKLIRPRFAEYEPVNYQVIDATKIIAIFDLRDAPHGLYDLQVANPDGKVAIKPYRYLIEEAQPLEVAVGMGGPSVIQIQPTGIPTAIYGVSIHSLTNVDTPYVHIEFGVPRLPESQIIPGERLIFRTNLQGEPDLEGVPWLDLDPVLNINGDLIASGFNFDLATQGTAGLSFGVEIYPELKRLLAEDPDFLKGLFDFELEQLAFDFYIQAAITPMTSEEYIDYQLSQASNLRERILEDSNAPRSLISLVSDEEAWGDLYLMALEQAGALRPEDTPPPVRLQPEFLSEVSIATAGLLSGEAGEDIIKGDILTFFDQIRKWLGHTPDAYGSSKIPDSTRFDLGMSHPTHFEAFIISVRVDDFLELTSEVEVLDPNLADFFGLTGTRNHSVNIKGPDGYGDSGFVPLDWPLPYLISFENPSNSQGALSEIRIVEQLDSDLDLRSFKLGDITLGNLVIDIPENVGAFTGEIDYSQECGFVLQINAGVDIVSGIATWLFKAIDPETGMLLSDTTIGLLNPGERGEVSYTIEASPEAKTGDQIEATARVFFNKDTPMDTKTIVNTIDALGPTTTLTVQNLGNGAYHLNWKAEDDILGSGVKDHTVFVSYNDGPFFAYLRWTKDTSLLFKGKASDRVSFVVLSCDQAGNVEQSPEGLILPAFNPQINLGSLPEAPKTWAEPLPVAEIVTEPSTNPLFLHALLQIPASKTEYKPSSFKTIFEPFMAEAFAYNIPQSGAGIGSLGIAFQSDGSIFISGGAGRNQLWKFSSSGGKAGKPLAELDVPIYDMVFDSLGQLWATTGGGPLVQLDPETGQILQRFSDGIQLGLASDPNSSRLYVSTSSGVQIFDTITQTFRPFSTTRVEGLALSPDGTLWGVSWPDDGRIIKFDRRGRAQVVLSLDEKANGLAFGQPGTSLEGLLFVNHESGSITLVDLASMETVKIATEGTHGIFTHISPDGRVYITQSSKVDVLFPKRPPKVIASSPV